MSCSDYKKLSEGYMDNTRPALVGFGSRVESFYASRVVPVKAVKTATPPPPPSKEVVDKFLNFVYGVKNDWMALPFGMGIQLQKDHEFYGVIEAILRKLEGDYKLKVDSMIFSKNQKTNVLTMIKLFPVDSLVNNRVGNNGESMVGSDEGMLTPYTHTSFSSVGEKEKNMVFLKFVGYLEKQRWTACKDKNGFVNLVQSCDVDIAKGSGELLKLLGYKFDVVKNKNPVIIQVLDMCRMMLRLKYEVRYVSVREDEKEKRKLVFSRFCKEAQDVVNGY